MDAESGTLIGRAGRGNPIAIAVAGGVGVHAVVLFLVLPFLAPMLGPNYGIGFSDDYDKLALNLINGAGYRFLPQTGETLMREPAYPLLLAATFSVFGYSLAAARLVNLLLSLAIACVLARMVGEVSKERAAGVAAVALFFAHPGILIAEARGGFEILYALGLVLFGWRLARALRTQRRIDYFWVGLALGFSFLVRSSLVVFPVVVVAWLVVTRDLGRTWREIGARAALLVLGAAMVGTPWLVRNYAVVDKVVPTATVSGIALHVGEYVCRSMGDGRTLQQRDRSARDERAALAREWGYRFEDGYYFPFFYSSRDELAFAEALQRRVANYYVQNPTRFLECAAANVINFWIAGKNLVATALNAAVQLPYLALAVMGAVLLRGVSGGRSLLTPLLLVIAYTVLIHSVSFAQARYSVPLIPLLAALGAIPVAHAWRRWRA